MSSLKRLLCFGILTIITSSGFAQIVPWTDNIPSAIQPFENNPQLLASYTQNNILIYGHPASKTQLPTLKSNPQPTAHFTSAALIVPVNVQQVAKTLTNFNQYVGLFPTLKSVRILEQAGNVSQVKYRIAIPTPIPVLNVNEEVTVQHQIQGNSIATLVIDAPLPYAAGKFEWFALDDKRTLVTLTQWGDVNQPKGFLLKTILAAQPEAKLVIPSGINAFILESLRVRFAPQNPIALEAGQFPKLQLNAAQMAKVAQLSQNAQQPVSFMHAPTTVLYTHGRENMRFSSTYQWYNKPAQNLHKWLNPQSYQELLPRHIKRMDTTPLTAQGQEADIKVHIGLGVINIPFAFKLHFNYPDANQNSLYANGGDLRYIKGQMLLEPMAQGTLFQMNTAVKIDDKAPFLLRAARSLPYHDVLPALGVNSVLMLKIKGKV